MNSFPQYNSKSDIGVTEIQRLVEVELDWIFRRQDHADIGIDAQIEQLEDGSPRGRLIAAQIKSGESHLKKVRGSYRFYGEMRHYHYWLNHSLPVVLIVWIPSRKVAVWQIVEESKIEITGKQWAIDIPIEKVLGEQTKAEMQKLFEGTLENRRQRALALDYPLMQRIADGENLLVDVDLRTGAVQRGSFTILCNDENNDDRILQEWSAAYFGYTLGTIIEEMFPWADVFEDEEFYDDNISDDLPSADDWRERISRAILTDIDSEPHSDHAGDLENSGLCEEDFSTVREFRPYSETDLKFARYRLELHLNALGLAFLAVMAYLRAEI